ncbi:MAG: hypothetical protein ACI3YC_06260 [Alloprevotella sp.]
MKKLVVNICASKDSFGAYSVEGEGIYGAGSNIKDCQNDVLKSIEEIKQTQPSDEWPAILKEDYEIEWHYDVQSLLLHYGALMSLSGLERITGIHQKQLWAYMNGRSNPRKRQVEKIENTICSFGNELSRIRLMK